MVSFQETAVVSVEMTREVIARTPPPAFLFPIHNVKDPTTSVAPPFSARRRRGAVFNRPGIPCQPSFFKSS